MFCLLLLAFVSVANAASVRFEACEHADYHPGLQAIWRVSSINPHRSELQYELQHEFLDHLRHATDILFEVESDGVPVVSEIHPVCGQSQGERIECLRQLEGTNALAGTIQLNVPFTAELGTSTISVLEPNDFGGEDTIYKLCSK